MHEARERMRVALIAATLVQGGAEKQFVYLARALLRAGMDVRVYSLTRGEFYEPVLKDIGLKPIWIGRFRNPLLRLAALVKEVHAFRPHVIHSSHLYANLYAALGGRLTGAISVGAMRGSLRYSNETNGAWTKWLITSPNVLVTNSRATWTDLNDSGFINVQRIHLIPNVISLSDFDNFLPQCRKRDITAIFLGRLIPVKRLDNFLRALAVVRRSHPTFKGMVVGDGPERDSAEKLALELTLGKGGVTFRGRRDDVPRLLGQADMLVQTSQDEGFPNVLIEAMAARLPIVTTPAGDSKFIVENGISGYVVPFGDVAKMAERMARLAESSDLRRQMGEAGRRRVEQVYSFETLSNTLLSFYLSIGPLKEQLVFAPTPTSIGQENCPQSNNIRR